MEIELKRVAGIVFTALAIATLTLAFNIQKAESLEPQATEWTRTYGGANYDHAWSVVETVDGGYVLAGYTTSFGAGNEDFWLVKTDASGNVEWNRTYGGVGCDRARAVVEVSDGGYVLAGYTVSFGAGSADFWLVKVDSSGNVEWNRTYGGYYSDWAYSVLEVSDGGYVLAGDTTSFGAGFRDFWLVKVDSSGSMEWNATFGGEWNDEAWSVVETVDGGYVLAGYTTSFGAGSTDFWLVKVDSSGSMEWNRTYGGADYDEAWSVLEVSDGGYVLAGDTVSFGAGSADFWLVKVDSSGNVEWDRTYGGVGGERTRAVLETVDGGYVLAGYTTSSGEGNEDFWLVKVDSFGNVEWNRTYGGYYSDWAYSVLEVSDGGYVLAGFTTSFGAGSADFWLVKAGRARHDVAVTDVTTSKTVVGQGYSASINVTVGNQGDYTETFKVTVFADQNASIVGDEIAIAARNVTVASGNSITIPFIWNTTGFSKGVYAISANAAKVPGETDTDDNAYTDGTVRVNMVGDLNSDGKVSITDVVIIALAFGSKPGDLNWNPDADLNNDCKVTISDIVIAALHFGETDC